MPSSPFSAIGSALGGLLGGGDESSGGDDSSSKGVSMEATNKLLQQLITAVNAGGDVFLDGAKVGKSLALATSDMG